MQPHRLLALVPRATRVVFVLFEDERLRYCGELRLPRGARLRQVRTAVRMLVAEYRPTTTVIGVAERVQARAHAAYLEARTCSGRTLTVPVEAARRALTGGLRVTKVDLALSITAKYPELRRFPFFAGRGINALALGLYALELPTGSSRLGVR